MEFTLAAEGDDTRLRVVESGFRSLACGPEQQLRNADRNREGWEHELGELADYASRARV